MNNPNQPINTTYMYSFSFGGSDFVTLNNYLIAWFSIQHESSTYTFEW